MMTKEDFLKYRCPRWDEFPAIELYMDQVLSILENSLSGFSRGERTITSSMINNYVKQKIVKPPVKKKYDRVHLSYLYAVSILKPLMSISDICRGIAIVLRKFEIKEAYGIFCSELEGALKDVFSESGAAEGAADCAETALIRAAVRAFANLMYTSVLIDENGVFDESCEKS